jgi:hypothetical protein
MPSQTKLTLCGSLPYQDLVTLTVKSSHFLLPDELATAVVDFLVVKRVNESEVTVTTASSDRGDFPLSNVLVGDTQSWWISESGSMPGGKGEEYIEFRLSDSGSIRRVQSVSVAIPPLPFGPLSVLDFRIDYSIDGKAWLSCDRVMRTRNINGLQRFTLSDFDAVHVRLVCLSNQISELEDDLRSVIAYYSCVGLYSVRWD